MLIYLVFEDIIQSILIEICKPMGFAMLNCSHFNVKFASMFGFFMCACNSFRFELSLIKKNYLRKNNGRTSIFRQSMEKKIQKKGSQQIKSKDYLISLCCDLFFVFHLLIDEM